MTRSREIYLSEIEFFIQDFFLIYILPFNFASNYRVIKFQFEKEKVG